MKFPITYFHNINFTSNQKYSNTSSLIFVSFEVKLQKKRTYLIPLKWTSFSTKNIILAFIFISNFRHTNIRPRLDYLWHYVLLGGGSPLYCQWQLINLEFKSRLPTFWSNFVALSNNSYPNSTSEDIFFV